MTGTVVLVNECRIWAGFRQHGPAHRFTDRTVSIGGNLVAVACEDREHADWLAAHLIERGIPKSAVKVAAA